MPQSCDRFADPFAWLLLGVELGREHAPAADGRNEGNPVVALGKDKGRVVGHAVEAVHEIEGLAVGLKSLLERAALLHEADRVPAHVRHLEGRGEPEAEHPAGNDAEALHAALLGTLEKRLHAEAHAEEGPVGADPVAHGGIESRGAERKHAVPQGAHARKHKPVSPQRLDLGRGAHDDRRGADGLERLRDAAQVADARCR